MGKFGAEMDKFGLKMGKFGAKTDKFGLKVGKFTTSRKKSLLRAANMYFLTGFLRQSVSQSEIKSKSRAEI